MNSLSTRQAISSWLLVSWLGVRQSPGLMAGGQFVPKKRTS